MAEVFRIEVPIRVEDQTDPGLSRAKEKLNGFDKTAQKTQERLNQMNRTKYQVVLDALDRASGTIGKVSSKARSIAGKTFSFTMKVIDMATAPLRGIWNFATSIQGAILGATGAFAGIYKPMDIAGDYEQTQIAFETMLKSAEKAEQFLKDASEFANKTPFEFPELINSSKLLLAFGFETDKILDLMTVIGDTSSGLGAGAEGIDRITRALGQMQAKGRAQAEELLQLQELGVPANQILQEELGLTGEQVANIGKESIEAAKVIDALLRGMDKRFGGMMANQSKTAKGMISTLKDTLQNSLLRPWGQGLWEGVKPGLEKITTWIDENQETITAWGEAWKKAGANISKWAVSKVEDLQNRIRRMTNSQEWKDAQTFGAKMKIAWDQVIAQPFNEWWNSTGKVWIADKASKVGEGIGSGMTMGLLALLGIDVSATTQEGKSVGGAFIKGFMEGFDTEKITEGLKTWADKNKEIVVGLGILIGGKLAAGIISGLGKLKDAKDLFGGKGSKDGLPQTAQPSAYSTQTMQVTAQVVHVYGKSIQGPTGRTPAGGSPSGSGGMVPPIVLPPTSTPPSLPPGKPPSLPPAPTTVALPGGAAAAGATGKVINTVQLANGSYVATGGALTTGLARTGVALGAGAATAGGAAAVGGASIAGIISGILGLGSAGIDVYQGVKASKAGNSKAAKDEYVTAGTKAGMVGAGAAAGAGIGALFGGVGAVPGAIVGAGVGGVAALFGGDKAGKALSGATDKSGGLSRFWENTKQRTGDTWESTKTGASDAGTWIADKWNGFSDWFGTSVWTPTKDIGISAANITAGAWSEGKDWVTDKWGDFSNWFDENAWKPVSDSAQAAGEWSGQKWDEARAWIGGKWADFSSWLDESAWTPASDAAQAAGQRVSDKWGEARTWAGEHWIDFAGWFEENAWGPVKTGAQAAGAWVSERWSAAKTWINEAWGTVSGWFSDTVWEPIKGAAQTAGAWLGDQFTAAKNAVSDAWSGVAGWFETNVWGPIKSGASAAWEWVGDKLGGIGEWMGDKWVSFKDWLGGLGQKGSAKTGLKTSQGKGSVAEHADGGIMTKPHMGIVAEAGPEAIIPLTKPSRAKVLWQQVGNIMGFTEARTNAIGENLPQVESVSEITKRYTNVKDIAENTKRLADVVDITRYRNLKQKDKTLTERLKHFTTTLNQAQKVNTYATGGILTKPHMGLVAEDGAEGIIPLSPSKRSRGIDLWQKTGEILGVRPYEDGGIVGDTSVAAPKGTASRNSEGINVTVNNKIEPSFTFEIRAGADPDEIVAVIKARTHELSDGIAGSIAERMERIFRNMPTKSYAY
jgi:tape measure domain-containing protein